MPLSLTARVQLWLSQVRKTSIALLRCEYFIAFDNKLSTTFSIFSSSIAVTYVGQLVVNLILIPLFSANGSYIDLRRVTNATISLLIKNICPLFISTF